MSEPWSSSSTSPQPEKEPSSATTDALSTWTDLVGLIRDRQQTAMTLNHARELACLELLFVVAPILERAVQEGPEERLLLLWNQIRAEVFEIMSRQ